MIRSNRRNSLKKGSARFAVCAAAGALVLGMAVPLAVAQQDPPPAVPKSTAAPKSSAGQAPAVAAAGDAPQGDAWVKLCMNNEQTANKEICLINHEGLEPNTGMVLIAAAVRKAEGEEKQQLLVRVPTAYALVIPAGVQIKIDEGKPIQLQYSICFPTSCQVQMELTKELFDNMRKGKQMVVAAMNIQQKTMGFPVPLAGFGKAFDGPPVDNAKYEESRRQLMEVFRKRQAELAAKAALAEQQKGAAGAPAASGQAKTAPATAQQKRPPAQPPAGQ
jgi:invasion protein IalB